MSKEIEKYICKVAGISLSEFRKGNYTEKNTIARDNYIYYLRNQEKIRVGKIAEMMQKTSSSISKSLSRTKNNRNSRIYPEIQLVSCIDKFTKKWKKEKINRKMENIQLYKTQNHFYADFGLGWEQVSKQLYKLIKTIQCKRKN